VAFYESVLSFDDRPDLQRPNGVWGMSSVEAAEMAKLAETTYRDVNIALANEFATFAETAGIGVDEVIQAANSQPFSYIHRPGIAVGGHCIPIYPRFYLAGHPTAELVATARRVNLSVPVRAVESVADALGGLEGRSVLILGVAYRGGVKETAYSGVFDLTREIGERGGRSMVSDPLYAPEELAALGFIPWDGSTVDAAIIQADHAEYRALRPGDVPGIQALYDGRAIVDRQAWEKAGVNVMVIGQGSTTR
jgi:nucleotide sugar dehydrogenase